MIVYTLALYVIPLALALVTLWIGVQGLKFFWSEVVVGNDEADEASGTAP